MEGINLEKTILYKHSSLRYFASGEHHVSRLCEDDVLVMVYEGVLRFSEDGVVYEIRPGQYHIQKHNSQQTGECVSDQPKYLYVHFCAEWTSDGSILPADGIFDYSVVCSIMKDLDRLSHSDAPYIIKAGKFYELLSHLARIEPVDSLARRMSDYIDKELHNDITLEGLSEAFNFSKNHIINIFKKHFDVTPITYVNNLRLDKAAYLLEVTSCPVEEISAQCGFVCYSNFYRQFVRKTGLSPKKWREIKRIGGIIEESK